MRFKPEQTRTIYAGAAALCGMLLLASWHLLPQKEFFYVLGHLSFAVTYLAYTQRTMLRLRFVVVLGLLLGLVYNVYIHFHMPPDQHLWPVLLWMSLFLVVNLYKAGAEVVDSIETPVTALQRPLLAAAFPTMHTHDWSKLVKKARMQRYKRGDVIVPLGGQTDTVMVLAIGAADELVPGREPDKRTVGTIWGELSFVMGVEAFNSSPCDIVVTSDHATVLSWDYEVLHELCHSNDRLSHALKDSFLRDGYRKHGKTRVDFPYLEEFKDLPPIQMEPMGTPAGAAA